MRRARSSWGMFALLGLCVMISAPAAKAQQQWKFAAPLPEAIGELYGTSVGGKIYVLGGLKNQAPAGDNWEYDPTADKWTAKKAMPHPAHHLMIAAWQNKIYVFGGFVKPQASQGWQPITDSWVYDPANDNWTALAPMPTARGAGQAVALDGKIYVLGGASSNKSGAPGDPIGLGAAEQIVQDIVEAYDPAANKWETRAPMQTPRNHFLAAAVGGKIYAVDGRTGSVFVTKSSSTDLVEGYDPATNMWTLVGRDVVPRGDDSGAAYNGQIYVMGGEGQDFARKYVFWLSEALNPTTGVFTQLPHMQVARHGFAAAIVGHELHVMGGAFQSDGMPRTDPATATHEVLDLGQ